jgi:hypothetical protein
MWLFSPISAARKKRFPRRSIPDGQGFVTAPPTCRGRLRALFCDCGKTSKDPANLTGPKTTSHRLGGAGCDQPLSQVQSRRDQRNPRIMDACATTRGTRNAMPLNCISGVTRRPRLCVGLTFCVLSAYPAAPDHDGRNVPSPAEPVHHSQGQHRSNAPNQPPKRKTPDWKIQSGAVVLTVV